MSEPLPTLSLPSGEKVPILGQGTWRMGESGRRAASDLAALRLGIDLGMNLIDTAEMYADGGAEEMVALAIANRREEVFLVSKVWPGNASRRGTLSACDNSLRRLRTDRIDLYLLHWPSRFPIAETVDAFESLEKAGKIRHWGVSNFDVREMTEVSALPAGASVATNQVLYNLTRRGIEADLLPWCRERRIPIMAYSPIEQGRMLKHRKLHDIAARHRATAAQIALAWLLRQGDLMVIPKAGTVEHVRENRAALDLRLTVEDLNELDTAFPPPTKPRKLQML
jgi:diketogulonate reductase-like aldo/keto reductase